MDWTETNARRDEKRVLEFSSTYTRGGLTILQGHTFFFQFSFIGRAVAIKICFDRMMLFRRLFPFPGNTLFIFSDSNLKHDANFGFCV